MIAKKLLSIAAVSLLLLNPVKGWSIPITLTESSSLTLGVSGAPTLAATNVGVDHWHLTAQLPLIGAFNGYLAWAEPENAAEVNVLVLHVGTVSFFDVFSDVAINNLSQFGPDLNGSVLGDGIAAVSSAAPWFSLGTQFSIDSITFSDTAASTESTPGSGGNVPEPGVLSLIGLGLLATSWSRRNRA